MHMNCNTEPMRGHCFKQRAANKAANRRAHAIANVVERLEVFAVLAVVQEHTDPATTKRAAEQIVDAVLALTAREAIS